MSYDYDDNDSDLKPEDVLADIHRLGTDFISLARTTLGSSSYNNREAPDIRKARANAKKYLNSASDKKWAFWTIFEAVYSQKLSLNERLTQDSWSGDLYLYGRLVTKDSLLDALEPILGKICPLTPSELDRKLEGMLKNAQFSPVKRYLEGLPKLAPDNWEPWATLANKLFGVSDHLSQVKLTRWLIGAVARVITPGCKVDTALVIKGKQGVGKTTLLQALFGDHFKTIHSHLQPLEKQRLMQQAWGCELGEIESTFRKSDISELKAFLTETHDSYRNLHKELGASRPRHCVFAGTTNEAAFLNDSTGSRRFWVIDSGDFKIPVAWAKANRDQIWAIAYSLYRAREQHWLTSEEAELSERSNKDFETENPFVEPLQTAFDILEAGESRIAIKASDISQYFLGISPSCQKRYSKEVAAALESLGFVKKEFKSQKLSGRFYVRPGATEYVPFNLAMVDLIRSARAYQGRERIQSL